MVEAGVALAETVSYGSAGTVEFVVDADTEDFFFLEMNTRIQVEHAVTEAVCGLDLVGLQLAFAAGRRLGSEVFRRLVPPRGHAIEVRICAENPARMFLPSPGRLARLRLPEASAGIRIDIGVREGDDVTPHYDSMIAKVISHASTRGEVSTPEEKCIGGPEQ
jgi:3-methylcrotonyl-CoA carboxylase alpha subunit